MIELLGLWSEHFAQLERKYNQLELENEVFMSEIGGVSERDKKRDQRLTGSKMPQRRDTKRYPNKTYPMP